jgi:flagellar biosynthesis protein FlhB
MAGEDRDPSQQTEEPTSRRLEQAREQGDQVKSTEVQTFILLLGAVLALAFFGRSIAINSVSTLRMFLAEPDRISTDPTALIHLMRLLLIRMAEIFGPLFIFLVIFGLGSNLIQNMPTFTPSRIAPNLSKLSPINGLKRMFGMDGVTTLLKGIVKIAIVGFAIWTQIWPARTGLEAVLTQSPGAVADDMTKLFFRLMIAALSAIAVIAAADYFWQRFEFIKRNRMSKQEIKEEMKETEGDPKIKAKIRQIRIERSRKRMMAAVPKATVVITNPTHFAVALLYEQGKTAAPICVAKGVDNLAFRIRDLAKDSDVPVVENPPLARALYASVEVDQTIPPEHYKAVAQVIGYVLRLSGKLRPAG